MTTITELKTHSLLSPYPSIGYHLPSDSWVVYWGGIGMTRANALIILALIFDSQNISDRMLSYAIKDLARAYYLKAFASDPDVQAAGPFRAPASAEYANRKWHIRQHDQLHSAGIVDAIRNTHTPQQALSWFLEKNAVQLEY